MANEAQDHPLVRELLDAAVEDQAKAEQLLAAHPELRSARHLHGETPLHFLAVEFFPEGVRWLAEHGMDVNASNDFGDTALSDAARLGALEMVRLLLELGADPNGSAASGDTILLNAIGSGCPEVVELLLDAGARLQADSLGWRTELALGFCGAKKRAAILALLRDRHPGLDLR